MTRATGIHTTITDWSVSPDAMRWTPDDTGTDLTQPHPNISRDTIHEWAKERLPDDIATLFTDWLWQEWHDWDPQEFPAINILAGALDHWRGWDPDDEEGDGS